MKKTVALLLTLILLFALSISALAYADGPTPEGGESQPGPQPEPAPVQPSGSGTRDALRFSESILNAPAFERTAGGTGTCDLGNGKTIYTILAETLKDWKSRGVKALTLRANGAAYLISLDDLLDCLNAEAGADSVHIKLDEDGLHLYSRVKEFGGVNRVDIATLQPAGDQSAAVQPAAEAEQERKPQPDPIPENKENRFDDKGRPLYTYEKKADGTTVETEYTYKDDGSSSVTNRMKSPDGTLTEQFTDKRADGTTSQVIEKAYDKSGKQIGAESTVYHNDGTVSYHEKSKFENGKLVSSEYDSHKEDGSSTAGTRKYNEAGQAVLEDYDSTDPDGKTTHTKSQISYNKDGKLERADRYVKTDSGTIHTAERYGYNDDGTSTNHVETTYSDNSKEVWDYLYYPDGSSHAVYDRYDMYGNQTDHQETNYPAGGGAPQQAQPDTDQPAGNQPAPQVDTAKQAINPVDTGTGAVLGDGYFALPD